MAPGILEPRTSRRPSQGPLSSLADTYHSNTVRLPSVSVSVRNASRCLSDFRTGGCPMAGRGAGGLGSIHQFVPDGVMGYFRVVLHPRLQQDNCPIAADRLHAQAQLLGD